MADYRTMFDSEWVRAWDLGGKAITVTIVRVEAGELQNAKARKKDRKPVVWFRGAQKPLALNKTNAKTIAALYGNDTRAWINQAVTIYPTRTQFGNEEVDCIRIKPKRPAGKAQDMPNPDPPPAEEPQDEEVSDADESAAIDETTGEVEP
jgi:hypothetical protein